MLERSNGRKVSPQRLSELLDQEFDEFSETIEVEDPYFKTIWEERGLDPKTIKNLLTCEFKLNLLDIHERSFRMLDAFLDAGGTFVDTAKVYADWLLGPRSVSEKTLGEWLRQSGKREQVVLATKGAHPELNTMHIARMSPAEVAADVDGSLQHLQTDVIDLY